MTGPCISSADSFVSGTLCADPAVDVPIGGAVEFEVLTLRADDVAVGLQSVKNWTAFGGCLLAILIKEGDRATSLGSAVVVGPGIAICAGHVVDHVMPGLRRAELGMLCAGVAVHGVELWRVQKITRLTSADLAILVLSRASRLPDGPLRIAAVTTRMPKLGEQLLISGFRSEQTIERGDDGHWKLFGNAFVAHGIVTQRFIRGRDKIMLPSSCLELSCPAEGGMSGGPAFDASGQVVGIVSSSVSTKDGSGPSFVSLLWPALVTVFDGGWPEGLIDGPTSLLELDRRLRFIDNDKCFGKQLSPDGKPAWYYDWWE